MAFPPLIFPSDLITAGSATAAGTTAGTLVLIPSTATGAIYITGLQISNGATASTIQLGYGVAAVAPTTTAILINPTALAINGMIYLTLIQPIKVPALNNVLATNVGGTTFSLFATYYVAP